MNILITGSNGFIGSNLVSYFKNKYNVETINRHTLDLVDFKSLERWISNRFFDVVIHTAIKGGSRLGIDSSDIIDTNIQMYLNLLHCKNHYKKFINIGSGAEICSPFTPYGLSKRTIFESLQDKKNFYSLRIFGLFNHNELDTRFIKANLIRYIQQKNMVIHKDRLMDFIYFDDFLTILQHYIHNDDIPKNIDCVYKDKNKLSDICSIINALSNHRVSVEIAENHDVDSDYVGSYNDIGLQTYGLNEGILRTYKELLKS